MDKRIPIIGGVILLIAIIGFFISLDFSLAPEENLDTGDFEESTIQDEAVIPRREAANSLASKAVELQSETKPFVDQEPQPRQVVLTILEADHSPAFPADVVIFQKGEYKLKGKTNQEGVVRCELDDGSADLLVWTPGAMVTRQLIAAEGNEQEIILSPGEELRGSMTVDGVLPKEPTQLHIVSWGTWSGEMSAGLPKGIKKHLPDGITSLNRAKVLVGLDGKFYFRRLPQKPLTGYFHLSSAYAFVIDSKLKRVWDFERGLKDIQLQVSTLPILSGRVVGKQNGKVVEGAKVVLHFSLDRFNRNTWSNSTHTNENGRFRIGIRSHEASRATLTIAHGGARIEKKLEGPFEALRDLGTLVVEGVRDLTFHIVDGEEKTLDKAIVLVPKTKIESTFDGHEGLHTVHGVSYSATEVEIGSLGFEPRLLPIDTSSESPIRVQLVPSNQLTVRVLNASGEPLIGRKIIISWKNGKGPFLVRRNLPPDSLLKLGATGARMSSSHRDGGGRTEFDFGKKSKLEVYALDSEVSFTVQAVGLFGSVVQEHGPFQLARGESRVVDVVYDESKIRDLFFRVQDDEGEPIVGAEIMLSDPKMGRGMGYSTDKNGEAVHKNVDMDRADLKVKAKGFREIRKASFGLRRDGEFELIIMDRGVDLVVKVVDHEGEIRSANVRSQCGDARSVSKKQDDGTYLLEHQAKHDVEVFAYVGRKNYSKLVDHVDGPIEIKTPEQSSIDVSWSIDLVTRFPRLRMLRAGDVDKPLSIRIRDVESKKLSIDEIQLGDYACWLEDYDKSKGDWFEATARKKIKVRGGKKASLDF